MDPFLVLKFLHIAFMFAGVAATIIPEVVLHVVASSREPRTIATFAGVAHRFGAITPIFFLGGAAFGLLTAWTGGLDFTAPWLLATYALFITAIVTGILVTDPWVGRIQIAAVASEDAPSPELTAAIDEAGPKIASGFLMLIVVVMLGLMVFKPGA